MGHSECGEKRLIDRPHDDRTCEVPLRVLRRPSSIPPPLTLVVVPEDFKARQPLTALLVYREVPRHSLHDGRP